MNINNFLNKKAKKFLVGAAASALMLGTVIVPAIANTLPTIDFQSPYTIGNIDGQQGWMKTGPYDVAVAAVSSFTNASGFGFGTQALRMSNAVTSGSFGDQTFSPGVDPAGEALSNNHFEASFSLGSTLSTQQTDLFTSISPDDGNGGRMSYVGLDDQTNGIHVIFYDATDPGLGTVASFNSTDVATINRTSAHTIKFVIDFVPGPANDVVKLYVDGVLKHTGTTWEDYYRYDPEQLGNENVVPTTSKLIFREGGEAVSTNANNGYLVDGVSLSSSVSVVAVGPPTNKDQCKKDGWKTFSNPTFKNQGACVSYVQSNNHADKRLGSFTASSSLYYNCSTACNSIYGTGPINFTWDPGTGNVTGGSYNEVVSGTTYYNNITAGSVVGNTVNLTFDRTNPNVNHFTFTGTLVGNVLSGLLDGPYFFTATGN